MLRKRTRAACRVLGLMAGFLLSGHGMASAEGRVVVFPAPDGIQASALWQVEVEGRKVFCHEDYRLNTDCPPSLFRMKISPQAYAIFDFEGAVTVRATYLPETAGGLSNLKIRPLARGIVPRLSGRTVAFTLNQPGDVTLDADGKGLHALHLFTNSPEESVPDRNDPDVRYFGPGVHDIEDLELHSGQTLYLAGGAVLRPLPSQLRVPGKEKHYTGIEYERAVAGIRASGDGIRIRGRGVVSGERGLPVGRRFGLFQGSRMQDLHISNVVFTRSTGWTVLLYDCADSAVERVRVLGYFTNSDGICMHSCHRCRVTDCFVHTADDCFEVKSKGSQITFSGCQVWCDAGTSMGVCHEIDGLMTDVVWRQMTVLHYTYPYNPYEGITSRGAIFIHPAMGGTVRNLRFEQITVEHSSTKRPLILLYNVKKPRESVLFFPDKPYSEIRDIAFKDIHADKVLNPEIRILDQSDAGLVGDISFEDVVINGERLTREDSRLVTEGTVSGVTVN